MLHNAYCVIRITQNCVDMPCISPWLLILESKGFFLFLKKNFELYRRIIKICKYDLSRERFFDEKIVPNVETVGGFALGEILTVCLSGLLSCRRKNRNFHCNFPIR